MGVLLHTTTAGTYMPSTATATKCTQHTVTATCSTQDNITAAIVEVIQPSMHLGKLNNLKPHWET